MSNSTFFHRFQPAAARASRVIREREILRLAAILEGADQNELASAARQVILEWVETRTSGQLPKVAWDHEGFEHLSGGRDCTAIRIVDDVGDTWAIRSDDPDTDIAQRVWTTEAIIGRWFEKPGVLMSLRVLASSPEGKLDIEPAVPRFMQRLVSEFDFRQGTEKLTLEPWIIESDDDMELLIEALIDPSRKIPIIVLSVPQSETDSMKPLINSVEITRATLGIARIVVLPARFTWGLTERLGKRLSVFDGAARVYLPGFTEDADPYGGHELFLAKRLTNEGGVSQASTGLRWIAANESLRRLRMGDDVLSYATLKEKSLKLERERLEEQGASFAEQLQAFQAQTANLEEELTKLQREQQWFSDEHAKAEDRARRAEEKQKELEYRNQRLIDQIKTQGGSPGANIPLPTSWLEFADWCDLNLIGRVQISARARRELKGPLFLDFETAAKSLLWLANYYYERRVSGGEGDLQGPIEYMGLSGIQNGRCGSDTFPFEWQGRNVDVDWHIKKGGNTRDPSRCLRIYYFWDDVTRQVVIASMPAHIRTSAT